MVGRMPTPTDPSVEKNGPAPDWERELDCAFAELEAGTFVDQSPEDPDDRGGAHAALWQRSFRARIERNRFDADSRGVTDKTLATG